jgi:TolB protein
MRSSILMVACVVAGAALSACSPLRQPLGSVAPVSSTGAAGGSGSSGTNPWGTCDPAVFRCYQDPGLLPSSPASALFGGTPSSDPAAKPVIVYPLDGAMHPINSADITFQWRRAPGGAQTLFRIQLQRLNGDVFEFFVPCDQPGGMGQPANDECAYHMPAAPWLDAATTARGETLTVDLAGVDPKNPATYAAADPITLAFSPEDLRGGLYYWSSAVTGTERLLFGARAPDPYIVHNNTTTNACGGCHAVSGDGSTIAWEEGDTGKGVLWVTSTATPDAPLFPPATKHDCGIQALNHDGTRVLVSFSGRLLLRDAKTGTPIGNGVDETQLGLTFHAFHPEWSPDDQRIAVTVSANGDSDWAVRTGSIGVLPYNAGQFGPVEILVPTGTTPGTDFNFYPTWSPDGHYIAFATGKVGSPTATPPATSYDQSTARLRLVDVDTKAIFELTAASGAAGSTSTWPKFAPLAQAGGLMFLSFNSKMDYGFFSNLANNMPQLWLTVIDPKKLQQSGTDPSRPSVWLPFQNVMQRNYASAWTTAIGCGLDAKSVGCGDGQVCTAGACAMVAP